MPSSTEQAVAGWALPGSDGGVVLPWTLFVVGRSGPLEMRPHDTETVEADGTIVLSARGDAFSATLRWGPADATGGSDVELTATSHAEQAIDASVGLSLQLAGTRTPWLLIPGLFYGDNGPAGEVAYPRWSLSAAEPDRFVSDRWAFRSDRAATPLVLASDGRWTAAIGIEEQSDLGLTGLAFAADGDSTGIGFFAPYHEQPVAYDGGLEPRPGGATFHRFEPGEAHTVRCRVYLGPPDRSAFGPIVRDLHARLAPQQPLAPPTDLATTASLAAEGLLRWHRLPGRPLLLETAAFERGPGPAAPGSAAGDRQAMHVGWLSGAPAAMALLRHGRLTGDAASTEAGIAVLDELCANLAPAGTFWGQWTHAGGWGKGWTPGLHARTLAEATLFVVRALALEEESGERHDAWRAAVEANLTFAVEHQRADGAFPAATTGRTGEVVGWDGTAGLAWVPALVEAAELLDRRSWLDAARRAGRWYAAAVDDGRLQGAPEDVGLAPSSEDGYVAVQAYVVLAEADEDPTDRAGWLGLARRAADWMLTFRYSYDVTFAPESALGRAGFRTRGLDQASVANQHLHVYGLICTSELVRLSRHLSDGHYALRAREHFAAARQTLVRVDGEWNGLRGMAAERFYQTACFGPKGGYGAVSHAWCLGLLLFAAAEALHLPELAEDAGG
jgi:hypothetical protein